MQLSSAVHSFFVPVILLCGLIFEEFYLERVRQWSMFNLFGTLHPENLTFLLIEKGISALRWDASSCPFGV